MTNNQQRRVEPPFPGIEVSMASNVIESVSLGLSRIDRPHWVIHRLIECGTLGQIFSDWNVGKSALAVDIACHVATGTAFCGRRVQKGPVLYIASEGSRGLIRRFKGWKQRYNKDLPTGIYRTLISARLPDPTTEQILQLSVEQIYAAEDQLPILVIIDTLAQTMVGDQNSTSDVDRFTALLRKLFPKTAVMLLHHVGHGEKTRSRGASSLPAACDWEFRLEEVRTASHEANVIKHVRLKNTKQRDEEQHKDLCFSLMRETLDFDEYGDQQTTVVAVPSPNIPTTKNGSRNWGTSARTMLALFDDLMEQEMNRHEEQDRNSAWADVTDHTWRAACLNAGISSDNFRKTKQRLIKAGEISNQDGRVIRIGVGQT
ncbi:MAG TPA: AAA family ATPase [Arenicellales bacterium]|nr:AAA family ATPase [Arenicellales bacterium]